MEHRIQVAVGQRDAVEHEVGYLRSRLDLAGGGVVIEASILGVQSCHLRRGLIAEWKALHVLIVSFVLRTTEARSRSGHLVG